MTPTGPDRSMSRPFGDGYIAELLKAVPIFSTCSKRELRTLAGVTDIVEFPQGATICEEGGDDADLFLIAEGTARVITGARTRKHLSAGDFFGEIALLDHGPRTASVVTDMPVICLRVDSAGFRKLLGSDAGLAVKMLLEVARRLRATDKTLD